MALFAFVGADLRGARDAFGVPLQGRVDGHARHAPWRVVERAPARTPCASPLTPRRKSLRHAVHARR